MFYRVFLLLLLLFLLFFSFLSHFCDGDSPATMEIPETVANATTPLPSKKKVLKKGKRVIRTHFLILELFLFHC